VCRAAGISLSLLPSQTDAPTSRSREHIDDHDDEPLCELRGELARDNYGPDALAAA
jgi:hypothetical protein